MPSEPSIETQQTPQTARRTQRGVALVTFVVVMAVLTVVFGMLFDSYLLGIGPALIMAGAITGGGVFARRRR